MTGTPQPPPKRTGQQLPVTSRRERPDTPDAQMHIEPDWRRAEPHDPRLRLVITRANGDRLVTSTGPATRLCAKLMSAIEDIDGQLTPPPIPASRAPASAELVTGRRIYRHTTAYRRHGWTTTVPCCGRPVRLAPAEADHAPDHTWLLECSPCQRVYRAELAAEHDGGLGACFTVTDLAGVITVRAKRARS